MEAYIRRDRSSTGYFLFYIYSNLHSGFGRKGARRGMFYLLTPLKEFKKEGPRNYLLPEHIDKIFEAYKERKDIEKFSHVANFQEIQENEFNLNIPRYVDTSEEEEEIDLAEVFARTK